MQGPASLAISDAPAGASADGQHAVRIEDVNHVARLPRCMVLTCASSGVQRRESAKSQLNQLGIDWRFVESPDLVEGQGPSYSPAANFFLSKRGLTPGEISTYRGHARIWSGLLASAEDVALVLEDDFLAPDLAVFRTAVADALAIAHCWDVAKLFDFRPTPPRFSFVSGSTRFVLHDRPTSGFVGYLINRRAAQALTQRQSFGRPVDEELRYGWQHGLRVLSVVPNPVRDFAEGLGGSLLETERQSSKQKHRNRLRSLYGNLLGIHMRVFARRWAARVERDLKRDLMRSATAGSTMPPA